MVELRGVVLCQGFLGCVDVSSAITLNIIISSSRSIITIQIIPTIPIKWNRGDIPLSRVIRIPQFHLFDKSLYHILSWLPKTARAMM